MPSLSPSMTEPRRWEDLPADLLAEIGRHLPCPVDRFNMSWACHDWWFAVQRHPRPRQLPWLLLPDPATVPLHLLPRSGSTRKVSFYCILCNGDTHNLRIRKDAGDARFFGSYDGGWLLLAHDQTNRHSLLNLHTDRRLFLPDYVVGMARVGGDVRPPAVMPRVILAVSCSSPPAPAVMPIVIVAATFSSPPTATARCFGAAIIDTPADGIRCPQLAFWRMEGAGDRRPVAMGFLGDSGDPWLRLQDVIHHQGAFHFLTEAEDVLVYEIFKFQEDEEGVRLEACLHRPSFLQGPPRCSDVRVIARYLVESRGELLMVVRMRLVTTDFPSGCCCWVQPTAAFKVYRVTRYLTGDGRVLHAWTELPSLDGRMLFVARGCSRAYEVADFPGFGFGDGIYFLDDCNSGDVAMVSQSQYGMPRRYNCGDNGRCRWVDGEPRLQVFLRWFTNVCSDYSSPIWFIP